ncbi:MAG: NAD(P)H-dependent oxidoreductase subunit E [Planctomycetes bacterium]|nr:NAD(P)H-dependent oxidoreductase subunit E [Planctomycetota bacterium]
MKPEFSEAAKRELEELRTRYPTSKAVLLPALRIAEREFGGLSDEALVYVAGLLDLPPAHVHGVLTFYTHYRRAGTGKHRIMVCSTLPCALRGSEGVYDHLCRRLGVASGETTPDGLFTLEKVECLGACGTAPVVAWNDEYHENLTIDQVDALVNRARGA